MEILAAIFGEGKDLTYYQMGSRGVAVFIIALLLIRISGRRSFGVRAPLDNIIVISLGAILSRAIVGASPFLPIIFTCLIIVVLHRALSWIMIRHKGLQHFIEGEKILLFADGSFIPENMQKALISKEEIMQGVRKSALTEDLDQIKHIYLEQNGDISAIKK